METNIMHPPSSLILPAWHEGDGPAPYVWSRLPKGSRCAWSCIWIVASPENENAVLRIGPNSWGGSAPDQMTDAQLLAEIGDHRHNPGQGLRVYELLDAYEDSAPVVWRKSAQKLVRDLRLNLTEYLAEFGTPADDLFRHGSDGFSIMTRPARRPGWAGLYERLVME
jgi:hypothetical protein